MNVAIGSRRVGIMARAASLLAVGVLAVVLAAGCGDDGDNGTGSKPDNPDNPGGGGGTTFTDSRDSKTYKKVTIGTQVWMGQNLNYDVPNVTTDVCYENKADSCGKYGRLYDFETAKTACPSGWHLPSDAEWTTLVNYAGGESTAGTKLKSSTGWESYSGVPKGTDQYGFSALPGGAGFSDGNFNTARVNGIWWSATEGSAVAAWYRIMRCDDEGVVRSPGDKTYQFSVRCVAD